MSNKSVSCLLYGGLGNQLFQIFATIAYALEHNRDYWFEYSTNLGKRPTYWHNLLKNLQKNLSPINNSSSLLQLDEPNIYACEVECIILNGYFQSPSYFEKWYNKIIELTGLTVNYQLINTVSMHFRRGDYKHITECHPILETDYYIQALDYICTLDPSVNTVQYFCEDEDHADILLEINALSQAFPRETVVSQVAFPPREPTGSRALEFVRFKGGADYEEMMAMAGCKHNIIANSSFSWWGAYLNPYPEKIVCYPSLWFGPMIPKSVESMFPASWTKI